jgi:hypothetical protein
MNNELERIWNETVVASFKVPRQLPGETEENNGNRSQIAGLRAEI